jgi:hypothetical protein
MRLIATNTVERIRLTGLLDQAEFNSATAEGRRMAAGMAMCRAIKAGTSPAI